MTGFCTIKECISSGAPDEAKPPCCYDCDYYPACQGRNILPMDEFKRLVEDGMLPYNISFK